jgi:hypothetical protein
VSAVADEKLSPELTFEIADLLRQRRSRNVKPLRCPTEMQFLGKLRRSSSAGGVPADRSYSPLVIGDA